MKEILTKVKATYKKEIANGESDYDAVKFALQEVPNNHGFGSLYYLPDIARKVVYFAEMGDPYTTTILAYVDCLTKKVTFKIGCWGNVVESEDYSG